jgi:hypothetical protein
VETRQHFAKKKIFFLLNRAQCYNIVCTPFLHANILSILLGKGKGKAIPLQALTGPEGSRTLWLPDFKTI